MGSDRSMPDTANQSATAAGSPRAGSVYYVEAAPVAEVIFDQLKYLLAHKDLDCSPACVDCMRLKQVERWLLLPFRSALRHPRRQARA